MKKGSKIISIFSLTWSILVYQFWFLLLNKYEIEIFYPGIALMILGLVFVIWNESDKNFKSFMELFLLLALNNFIDEVFFDPTKIEANELTIALLIIIRFIHTVCRKRRGIR